MKTYKNLIPKEITLLSHEEREEALAKQGASEEPLRLEEEEEFSEWTMFEGVKTPLYNTVHHFTGGEAPPKKDDLLYIVPYQVAVVFSERDDFVVPKVVRDDEGEVIGCMGFCRPVDEL